MAIVHQVNSRSVIPTSRKNICIIALTFILLFSSCAALSAAPPITWNPVDSGSSESLFAVTYTNGTYMVVGSGGTILTSTNASSWVQRASGTTGTLTKVAYGKDLYVVVGNDGIILTSPDGVSWTKQSSGTTKQLNDIVYAYNRFVVVGLDGTVLYSSDGITWKAGNSGVSPHIFAVAYGASTFCASCNDGTIITSPDGITWTKRSSGTTEYLHCVEFAKGMFMVAGDSGTFLTSPNGIAWTDRSLTEKDFIFDICSDGTYIVATSAYGELFYSPDAATWTKLTSGTTVYLVGAAAGKQNFIVVGQNGTILKASTASSIVFKPTLPLQVVGQPSAPSNLTASVSGTIPVVELNWKDNSNNENGFTVMRKTGGSYETLASTAANTTSYDDSSVTPGTTYTYKIAAKGTLGSSDPSNEAQVQIPAPQTGQNGQPSGTIVLRYQVGSSEFYVNNKIQTMDTAPMVLEGRTMLPIRFVATPLEATIAWNAAEKKTTVQMNGKTIELWLGKNTALINGVQTMIDPANAKVKPYVVPPGRTMLPLRFIAENLGCDVAWDPALKQITITY